MNVAVLPNWWAVFMTAYLRICTWSALVTRLLKRTPISPWPAVATSW